MTTRESRQQAAFRLAACLAFVAACIWMLTSSRLGTLPISRAEKVTVISWIGVVFFGGLSLRYAWSLSKPGTLKITSTGISQRLGWRNREWSWSDIEQVELRGSAVCMIHPKTERPVRLFGWDRSPSEIYQAIERERATQTPR